MEMVMAQNAYRGMGAHTARPTPHRRKRILWISRHQPESGQWKALRRTFGNNVEVRQDRRPFSDASDILDRFREGRYDDLVVVAPISVKMELAEQGQEPIEAVIDEKGDYVLSRFHKAEIKTTPL